MSGFFSTDADEQNWQAVENAQPSAPPPRPGFFQGLNGQNAINALGAGAEKGFGGFVQTGANIIGDTIEGPLHKRTPLSDQIFDFGHDFASATGAVADSYAPNPDQLGTAASVLLPTLSGLSMLTMGGPAGSTQAVHTESYDQGLKEGLSPADAEDKAQIEAMFWLPMALVPEMGAVPSKFAPSALKASLPGRIAFRAATGAAIQTTLGATQRATIGNYLKDKGYGPEITDRYKWDDATNFAADAVLGAAFGAISHDHGANVSHETAETPRDPDAVAAALAVKNHQNLVVETAPGIPTGPTGDAIHAENLSRTQAAFANDESPSDLLPYTVEDSPRERTPAQQIAHEIEWAHYRNSQFDTMHGSEADNATLEKYRAAGVDTELTGSDLRESIAKAGLGDAEAQAPTPDFIPHPVNHEAIARVHEALNDSSFSDEDRAALLEALPLEDTEALALMSGAISGERDPNGDLMYSRGRPIKTTDDQRDYMLGRHDGQGYAGIAEDFGKSEAWVAKKLTEARARVREMRAAGAGEDQIAATWNVSPDVIGALMEDRTTRAVVGPTALEREVIRLSQPQKDGTFLQAKDIADKIREQSLGREQTSEGSVRTLQDKLRNAGFSIARRRESAKDKVSVDDIWRLHDQGLSQSAIGRALGRTAGRINQIMKAGRPESVPETKPTAGRYDLATREARKAWAKDSVASETVGDTRIYAFKGPKDELISVNVNQMENGVAEVGWTFPMRHIDARNGVVKANPDYSTSDLGAIMARVVAIVEKDIAAHARDAYYFYPASPAHRRIYRQMAERFAQDGYHLKEVTPAKRGAFLGTRMYLLRADADVAADGTLTRGEHSIETPPKFEDMSYDQQDQIQTDFLESLANGTRGPDQGADGADHGQGAGMAGGRGGREERFSRSSTGRSTPDELRSALTDYFGAKDINALLDAGRLTITDTANLPFGERASKQAGIYNPRDGKAYLNADNVSAKDAAGIILHEIGVHHGMRDMLGTANWERLLNQVETLVKTHKAGRDARAMAEEFSNKPEHVPEETLAYLVENAPDLPLVQRILAHVRQFLWRTFGDAFGANLSVDDIRAMAVASLRRAAKMEERTAAPPAVRDWARGYTLVHGFHGTADPSHEGFIEFDLSKPATHDPIDAKRAVFITSSPHRGSSYAWSAASDANESAAFDAFNADPERDAIMAKRKAGELSFNQAQGQLASLLAQHRLASAGAGEFVMPLYARLKNPLVVTDQRTYNPVAYRDLFAKARKAGNDGVIIKDVIDSPHGGGEASDVIAVFADKDGKVRNIRSTHAAFDPDNSDSPNILASRSQALDEGFPLFSKGAAKRKPEETAARAAERDGFADGAHAFGSDADLNDLAAKADAGATAQELASHPVIQGVAKEAASQVPTMKPENARDSSFWRKRRYVVNGKRVPLSKALDHLERQADSAGKPAKFNKQALVVIGPQGAGKSSFIKAWAKAMGAAVPDADKAKEFIPEYKGGQGTIAAHAEGLELRDQITRRIVEQGRNLIVERVGFNPDNEAKIRELITQGYEVRLAHIDVTGDEAARRATKRFLATGRAPMNFADYDKAHTLRDIFNKLVETDAVKGHIQVDANGPEPRLLSADKAADLTDALGERLGRVDPSRSSDNPSDARSDGAAEGGERNADPVKQTLADDPGLRIATDDGEIPGEKALADAEADEAGAKEMAKGFKAAASCAIQHGLGPGIRVSSDIAAAAFARRTAAYAAGAAAGGVIANTIQTSDTSKRWEREAARHAIDRPQEDHPIVHPVDAEINAEQPALPELQAPSDSDGGFAPGETDAMVAPADAPGPGTFGLPSPVNDGSAYAASVAASRETNGMGGVGGPELSDKEWRSQMNAHLDRNRQWAKPGDYETSLSAKDEHTFRDWVKANKVPFNPNDEISDYDMRGFWKGLQSKDPAATTGIDPNDGKMHFSDKWKTPYHETFSNQSMYAKPNAPHWNGDKLIDERGHILFDDAARGVK